MNRLKGAVLGLAFMALPAIAQAQLITFDDAMTGCGSTGLSNGYQGFNWNNFYVLNATPGCYQASGYTNGIVSSPNVAYNSYANPASVSLAGSFTFNSVYMTAAWNDGLNVFVQGFVGVNPVYSQLLVINTNGPTLFAPNWTGVDEVLFTSSGGTPHGYSGGGTHIAFDNMLMNNATVTPEPATLLLLATGLAGIGGIVRRRHQKNS